MKAKNKSKIIAIVTAFFISIAFMPVSAGAVYADTTDGTDNENSIDDNAGITGDGQENMTIDAENSEEIVFEKLDDTYHSYIDINGELIKEEHTWSESLSDSGDEKMHTVCSVCDKCGATQERNEAHHYVKGASKWRLEEGEKEEEDSEVYYEPTFKCKCGHEAECVNGSSHDWVVIDGDSYKKYNSKYDCCIIEKCKTCNAIEGILFSHTPDDKYTKIDSKYHKVVESCAWCGKLYSTKKEKHLWDETKVLKKATFKKKGKVRDKCWFCGAVKTRTVPWKYHTKYSVSYDVTWNTYVYSNSKHVTVTLKHPAKGATVIVQIGKKKYKKKAGKGKKVKVKIKKPKKYGQKIYIDVKYKGKWIGEASYYDVVYYAKSIKKGMTKKQFKHTLNYWGSPDDTASASGGWTYRYYDDGSYIGFKKGKIKFWYNAD